MFIHTAFTIALPIKILRNALILFITGKIAHVSGFRFVSLNSYRVHNDVFESQIAVPSISKHSSSPFTKASKFTPPGHRIEQPSRSYSTLVSRASNSYSPYRYNLQLFGSFNSRHDDGYFQQNDEMKPMSQEEISDQMNDMYLLDYDWKKCSSFANSASGKTDVPPPVMYSAVCIIPPDDAWDMIQRARFMARDHTMYRWPPAIRLFHPFASRPYLASAASAIAEVIEKNNIEPFDIILDKLVIRPHWEIVEEIMDGEDEKDVPPPQEKVDEDNRELSDVEKLILNEEIKGKERYEKRMMKRKLSDDNDGGIPEPNNPKGPEKMVEKKTKQKYKNGKKKKKKQDYNGPCIVCLEPNDESKVKIEQLRKLLKDELFAPYDSFSVSSALSSSDDVPLSSLAQSDPKTSAFKPSITLGTFATTDAAAKIAKRIQSYWEPLKFSVADIQLLSRDGMDQSDSSHTKELNSYSTAQYECDAMIMLMGEEIDTVESDNDALLSLLFEAGEDGGGAASLDYKEVSPEEKRWREERSAILRSMLDEDDEDIDDESDEIDEFWFDDEEDEDYEGATIVLGRTQFFLGEMRLYVGMPASNPMDNKDRVLGQGVSASVRRRGSTHRKGERYKAGDYGSKEGDYLIKKDRLKSRRWSSTEEEE